MTEWRTLDWLWAYEVSDEGQIRRVSKGSGATPGHILGPTPDLGGYLGFTASQAGVKQRVLVHRVVCEAFHGPCPGDRHTHHAAHIDGNKLNNRADNVRWATIAENHADKIRHGTDCSGERHHLTKLTWPQVREIRARYSGRYGEIAALAREYGVGEIVVQHLLRRKTWQRDPLELVA